MHTVVEWWKYGDCAAVMSRTVMTVQISQAGVTYQESPCDINNKWLIAYKVKNASEEKKHSKQLG